LNNVDTLIDTNLLLLLVVGATDPAFVSRHKNLKLGDKQLSKTHYNQLLEVIQTSDKLVSTPNILTETSNLLRQCKNPMRDNITRVFSNLINKFEEIYIPSCEAASRTEFIRFGLTDASILTLQQRKLRIVTADGPLDESCRRLGFTVVNLKQTFLST